jgi:hypothetical protein
MSPRPTINDSTPTENEIVEALRALHNKKSSGASGIRIEHPKAWHNQSKTDESCHQLWSKVVELVQRIFAGDDIPKAFCRGILVLLP